MNRPAVNHHGAGVRRVAGLHSAQERQEGGGVLGNSVIRPGRELEVTDLPLLVGAALRNQQQVVGKFRLKVQTTRVRPPDFHHSSDQTDQTSYSVPDRMLGIVPLC